MRIGYARVSTDAQDTAAQREALAQARVERIFTETASGARWDRPELHNMLEQLRPGDVVVVYKLDRLTRSLKDMLTLLEHIEGKEAGFQSLTEGVDTTTAAGRMVMSMLGAFAEYERQMVRERTRSGVEHARSQGKHVGRPKKLNPDQEQQILANISSGLWTAAQAARLFSIHASMITRLVARSTNAQRAEAQRPQANAALDLAAFAALVLTEAQSCPTGRYGADKVFIHHVWNRLQDRSDMGDLETFKLRLVEANRKGRLSLSRADLVQRMDPDDVRLAETRAGQGVFHFICCQAPQPSQLAQPMSSEVDKASQIEAAARALVAEGLGVGADLVYIADVIGRTGASKEELLALHRNSRIHLVVADRPDGLQQDKLDASTIEYRKARFVFVQPHPVLF